MAELSVPLQGRKRNGVNGRAPFVPRINDIHSLDDLRYRGFPIRLAEVFAVAQRHKELCRPRVSATTRKRDHPTFQVATIGSYVRIVCNRPALFPLPIANRPQGDNVPQRSCGGLRAQKLRQCTMVTVRLNDEPAR